MKTISGLELRYIINELNLNNAKVDKIFQLDAGSFMIRFHSASQGKVMLNIKMPNKLYKTEIKEKSTEPQGFVMYLRKKLSNARLLSLKQIGLERIVEFKFQTKEGIYYLIIELFAKGNVLLLDEEKLILQALYYKKWKDRVIKPKGRYDFPPKRHNLFEIDEKLFKQIIESAKKPIVKILAVDFGLSGIYAEELLLRANIVDDKNCNLKKLLNTGKTLLNQAEPGIVFEGKDIIDVTPFRLKLYADKEYKKFDSFNQALDKYFLNFNETTKKENPKLIKLRKIIDEQERLIKQIKEGIKDSEEKANAIYNNYLEIKDLFDKINELKGKSWDSVQKFLEKNSKVKKINLKEKTIVYGL